MHSMPRIKKPHPPLAAYSDNAFKLYGLNVGLFAASLLEGDRNTKMPSPNKMVNVPLYAVQQF